MVTLKITQIRSSINRTSTQKRTLDALGLKGINKTVIHKDVPSIRGMVDAVQHLVRVEQEDN